MSSWDNYETSGAAAPKPSLEVTIGQTLLGLTDAYAIQDWIGEGCFGRIAKCRATDRNQTVAVKILKDEQLGSMEGEISMMEELSVLDPVRTNIVHFVEQFDFMGLHCVAFEMLEIDLYSFMINRDCEPLALNEIRPIAHQLLVALDALKGLGIMHTDIKPDNVMFTNLEDEPLRVKLIDFGEARKTSQAELGSQLQPTGYRAPEVTLGLPFTEAIDVWGLGCVLAFLYLGDNLFPVTCEYQAVKRMVALLGLPPDHQLQAGQYSTSFFTEDQHTWRLLTPEEYCATNDTTTEEEDTFYDVPSCLDGLVSSHPENSSAKVEDRKAFIDLLKGLLSVTGEQRLTPSQALQHSYITMSHLKDPQLQGYLMISEELMMVCPAANSLPSPPEDQECVSNVTFNIQTDAPDPSTDQDSGVGSLCGQTSRAPSLTAPGSSGDEREPIYYSDISEVIHWSENTSVSPVANSLPSPPEDQECVSDATVNFQTDLMISEELKLVCPVANPLPSPPEDQECVSDATFNIQTDAPDPSTDQDSGVGSLCGQTSRAPSLTAPGSSGDEREPIYYSDISEVIHWSENTDLTLQVEDMDDTPVAKPPKRSFLRRVRRVLRRVVDTLFCCVHLQED